MAKYKNFEIVQDENLLSEDDIQKALQLFDDKAKINHLTHFAYILHDKDIKKDGTKREPHWHILIKMDNAYSFDYIAKRFSVPVNMVEKIKTRFSNALNYLTHNTEQAKKDGKYQYDDECVKSNYKWQTERQKAIDSDTKKNRKNDIINLIHTGCIREYNYTDYISSIEYDRFKRSIDNAFKYRSDMLSKEMKRDMECLFIQGDSGFGKTTYAKMYAEKRNLSYYVSSSSNDVLDGYKGQDILILDDLRPSSMGLSDLLKMLDNNTASSVKSRYRNKVLECKYIIITTTLDIDTFFKNVFTEQKETIVQLKRRCKTYLRVKKETIDIFYYDELIRDYNSIGVIDNPVNALYKTKELTQKDKDDILESLKIQI